MKYKLIIFDMDGTFIDSKPFHAQLFFEFFPKYWRAVSYECCEKAVGTTVRQVFEAAGIPGEQHDRYYDLLDDFYDYESTELIPMTAVAKGFHDILGYLKAQNIKTAVVTNSLNCVVKKILEFHKLTELFDSVVGADRDSVDKVERCRKLLVTEGITPDEVLFVGDTESDMELAKVMNYDACFAKTPIAWYKDAEYIEKKLQPLMVIKDYVQLAYALEKM